MKEASLSGALSIGTSRYTSTEKDRNFPDLREASQDLEANSGQGIMLSGIRSPKMKEVRAFSFIAAVAILSTMGMSQTTAPARFEVADIHPSSRNYQWIKRRL